ncbi:MAG: hypothetical protein CMK09_03275 [Ponticaulis sp.]|nr:hypothetical protein [Ponticaulis sp.]
MTLAKTFGFPVLAVALAGCVSVLPEPVIPDSLYRFSSADTFSNVSPVRLPASVFVPQPEGATLLLGKNIIFEDEDGGLSLLSSAQWSSSAGSMIQYALLDRLSAGTASDGALALGDWVSARADYNLQWHVRDLVVREDDVVASFEVMLINDQTGEVTGKFEVTRRDTYVGKSGEAGVRKLIEVVQGAIDEIASKLPDYMS